MSSRSTNSSGPPTAMPALLTMPRRRVSSPSASPTTSAASSASCAEVTSRRTGVTSGCSSTVDRSRTAANTRMPLAAKLSTMALPIPVEAPVTITASGVVMPRVCADGTTRAAHGVGDSARILLEPSKENRGRSAATHARARPSRRRVEQGCGDRRRSMSPRASTSTSPRARAASAARSSTPASSTPASLDNPT